MGVRKAVDFRFPEWEQSYTQGGNHTISVINIWQTALDFTGKRGTIYLRHFSLGGNRYVYLRVTIDGVEYPIQTWFKAVGVCPFWILDFNKSIKIEHYRAIDLTVTTASWAYYEYAP